MNTYVYEFPFCNIKISTDKTAVTNIKLLNKEDLESQNCDGMCRGELSDLVAKELGEYFLGKRKIFTFVAAPYGTEFQKKVWAALCNIPYGETRSYKQIAKEIGNPKASRAVGMANNRNPIPIVVPCHRVIGADGSLVGYGLGLEMKRKLLDIEKEGNNN